MTFRNTSIPTTLRITSAPRARLTFRDASALATIHKADRWMARDMARCNAHDTLTNRGYLLAGENEMAFAEVYSATLSTIVANPADYGLRRAQAAA